ncbi:hypothetical protein [Herbidospora sp. RD11066]
MRGQDSGSEHEHDHEGKVPPPSFGQSSRDESYSQPDEGSGSGWFAAPTARPPQPEWPPAPAAQRPEPPTWPPAPAREPAESSGGWFSEATPAAETERPEEPGATWPTPRSWQPPAPVTEHTPEAAGHFGAAGLDQRSAWPPPVYDDTTEDTIDSRASWPLTGDSRSAWPAPVYDPDTEDTRDSRASWPPLQRPEGSGWAPKPEAEIDTQDTRNTDSAWSPPVPTPEAEIDTQDTRDHNASWQVPAYDPETEETRDHTKAGSWPPAQQWAGWPTASVEEPVSVDATTSGLPPLPEWPAGDERPGEPGDIAVWPPRLPGEETTATTVEMTESDDDPPVYPRHWPPPARHTDTVTEPDTGVATVPGDRPEGATWPPAHQWASDTGTRWPSAAIPGEEPAETTIPREEAPVFQEPGPAVFNGTVTDIPTDPEMPVQKTDPKPEPEQDSLFASPIPPVAPASPGRGFESLAAAPATPPTVAAAPTVAEGIVHPPLPKGYRPAEATLVTEVPAKKKKGGGTRKVLLAGGAVVVIAAIGASAYMAYSGEEETTGEAAPPPATTAPATPGAQIADPVPTVEAAVLDSETTDPRKLTLAEAFPAAKVTLNGRTFKRVKVNITDDCAAAAAGAFAQSLSENDCRRVLRATYVDGKKQYAVTTGIAVLPTKEAALAVDQTKNLGSNLWFRGLNGDADSGADRVAISGGYAAGMVWGRYIVFSYATYADGHTPGEKEKDLGPVSGAFRDQTAEIIEKRVTS